MNALKNTIIVTLFFFFVTPVVLAVEAAFLKYDQSAVTVTSGNTFQIAVIVDNGGEEMLSTDVYITYDAALLNATTVSAGSLFPTVTNDMATSGTVYIAGMVNDPASPITTPGTVATVTFQALADGTTSLTFDCGNSKIIKNDINATNIINCSENGSSSVTIGSGSSTDPTPTSASGTSGSSSGTSGSSSGSSSQLPVSGVFDNVIKFAVPGTLLLIVGTVVRLLL